MDHEVVTEVKMSMLKTAVFWVVAPCSLAVSLLIALMMEATRTSETLINLYQTTRRYNPDSHLRAHRRENLISYISMLMFWVTLRGLVGRYQRFTETYCLHLQP
jgi:hypothetical protein